MFSSLHALLVGTLLTVSVSALTDSERAAVLDSHNAFRQQIANGEAVNKDGTKLPTAANMLKLSYDTTMEVAAQKWADNCTGTVNSGGNVPYGQNSCWTYPQVSTTSMLTTHGTERFYKALSEIGVDPSLNFTKSVGQWSQLAWATTSRLGCGVSQCPANSRVPQAFTFIICYYAAPGNVQNQLIYQPGTPCSQCPAKTTCSSGLCANSSEVAVTTKATTKAPAATTKVAVVTTMAPVATTKAPVATTKTAVATTKASVATTKASVATTKASAVTTGSTAKTTTTAPQPASCALSSNTDSFRQQVLDLHNQLRSDMANGRAPNKSGFLPKGTNIYKIEYDCELEAAFSRQCQTTGFAEGVVSSSAPMTQQQKEQYLLNRIRSDWNQSAIYGVDENISDNRNTSGWALLAMDRLTKMGCATVDCGKDVNNPNMYRMVVGCLYDYPSRQRTAYVPGAPCTKDSDCKRLPNSVCLASEGLCKETSVYPASGVNTMCPGVTSPLDDRARMRAVDMHNHYRQSLIHGLEPMGNMNTFAPTGSNMYKMVWDCNVEAKAQEWANNNKFAHSTSEYRTYDGMYHGENNFAGGSYYPPYYHLEQATTSYWDELLQHGWKGVGNHSLTQADFDATIGHWSQVAWANTYQLGCGISPNGNIIICQYGPGGNYNTATEKIYPEGVPCKTNADCTKRAGNTCETATGLCVRAA